MPDPADFMTYADGVLSRPAITWNGDAYPAVSEPVPAESTVVRFVGSGPRYIQTSARDGVLIRDGELWLLPAAEATARADVQPYRASKSKPAPAAPAETAQENVTHE